MNTFDFCETVRKATFETLKYYETNHPDMMALASNALSAIKDGKEDYDRYRKEKRTKGGGA